MFFLLSLQTSKQHVHIILFKDEVYSTLRNLNNTLTLSFLTREFAP